VTNFEGLDPEDGYPKAGTNLLRFPWRPEYEEIVIRRATGAPTGFSTIATLAPAEGVTRLYEDAGLTPGETYYYMIRATGPDGSKSRFSPIIAGTPTAPPCAGDIDGDGDT